MAVANGKGVWHLTYVRRCPPCGAEEVTRVRRAAPKPVDPEECYDHQEYFCGWCLQ